MLMELACSICTIRTIPAPPDSTPTTRFFCRTCCARIERRKLRAGALASEHYFKNQAAEAICKLRRERHEAPVKLNSSVASSLPTPREEAAAILELVQQGTFTVTEARETIAVPEGLAVLLKRFEEITGRRGGGPLTKVVRWRSKVLAEFEHQIAERSTQAPGIPPAA